jgi:replicative superfamily II helicase
MIMHGVGFHHAGMEHNDRRAIEELFTQGDLPVLREPIH